MLRDLWRESSFGEALRDLAKEEGREEGLQEGRQEGRQELAQVALEGRFGMLSNDVVEALRAADDATLRAVVAHIATDSLEQARRRLGLA